MEVRGEFLLGENHYASGLLRQRLLGWRRFAGLGWVVLVATGLLASIPVLKAVDARPPPLLVLAVYVALASGGYLLIARWVRASLIRSWIARGAANPTSISFKASEAGLEMEGIASTTLLHWSAVSEILPTKRHWIFIGNSLAYTLPKRFFPDHATEQAFIRTAMSHLGEAARARSRQAADFAA
jgi:YcxB-like protein